jgi:hypothetical protein
MSPISSCDNPELSILLLNCNNLVGGHWEVRIHEFKRFGGREEVHECIKIEQRVKPSNAGKKSWEVGRGINAGEVFPGS